MHLFIQETSKSESCLLAQQQITTSREEEKRKVFPIRATLLAEVIFHVYFLKLKLRIQTQFKQTRSNKDYFLIIWY